MMALYLWLDGYTDDSLPPGGAWRLFEVMFDTV